MRVDFLVFDHKNTIRKILLIEQLLINVFNKLINILFFNPLALRSSTWLFYLRFELHVFEFSDTEEIDVV